MTNQAQYDEFTIAMDHFFAMQEELGMSTVWSMYEFGTKGPEFELFTDKVRKVTYEFVRPDATVEEIEADLSEDASIVRSVATDPVRVDSQDHVPADSIQYKGFFKVVRFNPCISA